MLARVLILTWTIAVWCLRSRRRRAAPRDDTVEFILNWVRESPERQLADADQLNAKIVQVFTAASILLGLASLVNLSQIAKPIQLPWRHLALSLVYLDLPLVRTDTRWLTTIALVGAFTSYVLVAFATLQALRSRKMQATRLGNRLWREYWMDSPSAIRLALVSTIDKAFTNNVRVLQRKERAIQWGLGLTFAEAALVATAVVLSRIG